MRLSKARRPLTFFLGIALVCMLLQVASIVKQDALVFPGVPAIFRALVRLLLTAQTYCLLFTTLRHLVISLFFATVAGISLGIVEGKSAFIRRLLSPLMTMLRSIPLVVLIVIIMVLSPYSRVPCIAASLMLVPIISEAACEGFLSIDRDLIDVYQINGGFCPYVLFHVYLPLMAGFIRQAYINVVGMGIKMLVSAEYLVQTKHSLGKAVNTSIYFSDYADIYAYALIMIALVLLVSELPLFLVNLPKKR